MNIYIMAVVYFINIESFLIVSFSFNVRYNLLKTSFLQSFMIKLNNRPWLKI